MADAPLRLRIVFPGAVDGVGGAELQTLAYLGACDPARVDAELVLLGENPSFQRRAAEAGWERVRVLNLRNRHPWRPCVAAEYGRWLAVDRPDVVHLFGLRQEVMTRPMTRLRSGAKVVSAIRGMESHRSRLHSWLNRGTAGCVDLWISNSEATRELFVERDGLPADRIAVVPNGVAVPEEPEMADHRRRLRAELGLDAADCAVVCVANLFAEKRQADLVRAVAALDDVPVRLYLVGRDTHETPELLRVIESSGAGDRVVRLGYRADARQLLAAMDVLALASEKEGMPASVLEGMAAGLPVLTTPVAELPHMVGDDAGILVPVGDVERWRETLRRFAGDPDLRRRTGAAARRRVIERYSLERTVEAQTAHYERLTGRTAES